MATDDLGNVVEKFLTQAKRLRQYEVSTSESPEFQEVQREVLVMAVDGLRAEYGAQLVGTPEHAYLDALARHYSNERDIALNPNLDLPIEDIEFTYRTRGILCRENIKYVGELVRYKPKELTNLRNCGTASLGEIKKHLKSIGLKLGMDIDYVRPEKRDF